MLIVIFIVLVSLNDDRFDGNIFVFYVGNGFFVFVKVKLKDFLKNFRFVLLVFFFDDSKDCK